jgi:hypothetical protein
MKSKQDNGLSRRNFVKNSTLATTGLLSASKNHIEMATKQRKSHSERRKD